jgi:hypothetical protein
MIIKQDKRVQVDKSRRTIEKINIIQDNIPIRTNPHPCTQQTHLSQVAMMVDMKYARNTAM